MNPVGAVSYDKAGVAHAFKYPGAEKSACGWTRYNFNKVVDLRYYKCDSGDYHYEYIPPTDVFVTCLLCLQGKP